jgi:hypothetical protein
MTVTLPAHVQFLADAMARHQPPQQDVDGAEVPVGANGTLDFITFSSTALPFEDMVSKQLQVRPARMQPTRWRGP